MESDDDFYSSPPLEESSPPVQLRKLKRLKKTRVSNEPKVKSVDALLSLPTVDFAKIVELESSKTRPIDDFSEELDSQSPFEDFDDDNHRADAAFDEDRRETRRALDFGDQSEEKGVDPSHEMEESVPVTETDEMNELREDPSVGVEEDVMELGSNKSDKKLTTEAVLEGEFEGKGIDRSGGVEEESTVLKTDKSEKKHNNEGKSNEMKQKKKMREKIAQVDTKPKSSSSNKKKEEKERKATLQQLHAESQRLLRETRDAAFKPIPVAQKPISSILEKIRKRKLELSIKTNLWDHSASTAEISDSASRVVETSHMSKSVSIEEKPAEKLAEVLEMEMDDKHKDLTDVLQTSNEDESNECGTQSTFEKEPSLFKMDKETAPAFRAPLDDTQDIFTDTQTSDNKDELPSGKQDFPTEEVMAPSLLTMNLKFDSVPLEDDMSSDEEDNDKENIEPHPHRSEKEPASPKGDPVMAFVDDEAVEEDDSDNDLSRFKENEEDEDEDFEELKDMIATDYKENPVDNDKRNELHQKWLEQQDAAGTDNLLQRLNYGSKFRDESLINEESDEENEEEFYNEGGEDAVVLRKASKINSWRAKEMIADMFAVKDDDFLSDDEETEKKIVQQRLLEKVEEKVTLLSPAEDENSREVFGLIKKLNLASDTKKKPKISSFFDTMVTGGNSNSSSRSSFLGRASSHSLPSSRKRGSTATRSYIFGRDDSNSRSSISAIDDSSQIEKMQISTESQPTRSTTTKFSSSQAKFSSQRRKKSTIEATKGTSLFEILKRSSSGQSDSYKQDDNNLVGLTQFASFKLPKKSVKMEG